MEVSQVALLKEIISLLHQHYPPRKEVSAETREKIGRANRERYAKYGYRPCPPETKARMREA